MIDILQYLGPIIAASVGAAALYTVGEAILGLRAKSRFHHELIVQALNDEELRSLIDKAERKELTDADVMAGINLLRRNLISLSAFDRQLVETGLNQQSRAGTKNYVTDILTAA